MFRPAVSERPADAFQNAIRTQCRGLKTKGNSNSIITNFKKTQDGFDGTIVTLALNAKVKFVPNEKTSDKQPDFRLVTGKGEIGAAWKPVTERASASASRSSSTIPHSPSP